MVVPAVEVVVATSLMVDTTSCVTVTVAVTAWLTTVVDVLFTFVGDWGSTSLVAWLV